MEVCLHNRGSNVISMNSLNTIIPNAMEKSKLGEASLYENDLFSSPSLEEKICSDNALSPTCDNSNHDCDILNPPTESIPFKIPMKIVAVLQTYALGGPTLSTRIEACSRHHLHGYFRLSLFFYLASMALFSLFLFPH